MPPKDLPWAWRDRLSRLLHAGEENIEIGGDSCPRRCTKRHDGQRTPPPPPCTPSLHRVLPDAPPALPRRYLEPSSHSLRPRHSPYEAAPSYHGYIALLTNNTGTPFVPRTQQHAPSVDARLLPTPAHRQTTRGPVPRICRCRALSPLRVLVWR